MSIEKFLENVEEENYQPGPFKARLKHQLSQKIFEKKTWWNPLAIGATAFASIFFTLFMLTIIKPDFAQRINYALNKSNKEIIVEDKTRLAERKIKDINNLDIEKSYIIKKIEQNNKSERFVIKELNEPPMIGSAY